MTFIMCKTGEAVRMVPGQKQSAAVSGCRSLSLLSAASGDLLEQLGQCTGWLSHFSFSVQLLPDLI